MKIQQKIFAGGMALLIACGSFASVHAGTITNGSYQTVRHSDIQSFGGIHYDTAYGVTKTDNDNYATFYETYKEAWLGNYGAIIEKTKYQRSKYCTLSYHEAILARENDVVKNTAYYSAARSHAYEPSNSCDVIFRFSSNNLK